MSKRNRFGAMGWSLLMALCVCACGSTTDPDTSENLQIAEKDTVLMEETTTGSDPEETTDNVQQTITTAAENSSKTTTTVTTGKKGSTTTAKTTTGGTITYIIKNTTRAAGQASAASVGASGNSRTTTKAPTKTTTTATVAATTTTEAAPTDEHFIDFGNLAPDGSYSYENGILSISQAGTYTMSGTLGGSVVVDVSSEEKVKLCLDGAQIVSSGMPCIQVDNADKVTVRLADGSSNVLECYDTNAAADAALFSKDDLTIKGSGSLYIFCNNEHGIACNDDLEIENGDLLIDAEKNGIVSHKSIWITGGSILSNGDNCGIRCRDAITISGGQVTACGGKKTGADRGGIISDTGNFYIEGGNVMALGMNQTVPGGQASLLARFPEVIGKDNVVAISLDGTVLGAAQPNKKYSCVLLSDGGLYGGGTCTVWLNDSALFEDFALEDGFTEAMLQLRSEETELPDEDA